MKTFFHTTPAWQHILHNLTVGLFGLLCLPVLLFAQSFDDLTASTQIQQASLAAIEQNLSQLPTLSLSDIKINPTPLNPRLQLATCEQPLQTTITTHQPLSKRQVVKVTCPQPRWQVYATATLNGHLPIVVSRQMLTKNTTLDASLLTTKTVSIHQYREHHFTHIQPLVGLRLKRNLAANQPLKTRDVANRYLVEKNDPITLLQSANNLTIKAAGQALQNGTLNQYIDVINLSSQTKLRAKVVGEKVVKVE